MRERTHSTFSDAFNPAISLILQGSLNSYSEDPESYGMPGFQIGGEAGLAPIKINVVVERGVNDHTVLDLLEYFRGTGHIVRLIEYMDVGNSNHWSPDDVVSNAEWVRRIGERWPIEPIASTNPAETARRYRYRDGQGEIGFISSITQPFCGGCTRARVTADGILYTCLFSNKGTNLMPLIRHGEDSSELAGRIREIWEERDDRYSEERGQPVGVERPGDDVQLPGLLEPVVRNLAQVGRGVVDDDLRASGSGERCRVTRALTRWRLLERMRLFDHADQLRVLVADPRARDLDDQPRAHGHVDEVRHQPLRVREQEAEVEGRDGRARVHHRGLHRPAAGRAHHQRHFPGRRRLRHRHDPGQLHRRHRQHRA